MKSQRLLLYSLSVALGGFLFGFDTAVISGAEESIQHLWNLGDVLHGFTVAIALYGTVLGALFGGIPSDRLGRKRTLFWIGVAYLISAIGSALATDKITFMVFRFIGGLAVGASSVAAPMYISEIAPASSRGKLVALFQLNVVVGILVAYVSNYLIQGLGENAWRWMLGVESFPALVFSISVLFISESPRWLLVKKNDIKKAESVFAGFNMDRREIEDSVSAIRNSVLVEKSGKQESLLSKKFRFPLLLALLFAFFNQFAGINAVIYYAPRIFRITGLATSTAFLSTAGIGLANLIFTIAGIFLIDRVGRKKLMLIGSAGLIINLLLVARAFYTGFFTGVEIFLFLYIAFFAISQGAVIWVFISEIFPNQVRASGQAAGCFTHWILAAVIANVFPFFVNLIGGAPIFLFFAVMMVLQLLYVLKLMPETRNITLEELEMKLIK
jgi:SP family arabinose:H+ symporter-like MFS transporter